MIRRTLPVLVVALALGVACGKDKSPTAPTPPPTQTPPPANQPPPAPTAISMDGRVMEAAPTASTTIGGATLRIGSGDSAGATTTSDGNGYFIFRDIRPGNFSVEVSAPGYDGGAMGVTIATSGSRNFNLRPSHRILQTQHPGQLSGGDARCATRLGQQPCRIIPTRGRRS